MITGSKSVLKKSKCSIPPSQFEILSSTTDKAEFFAQKFSSSSTHDTSRVSLADFPPKTASLLSYMHLILMAAHRNYLLPNQACN